MECSERKDYIYCPRCNENVSRSTYRRHQLMSVKRKREARSSSSDSDSSESSELDPPNSSLGSFDIESAYEGDDCDENVTPVYSSSMQGGMAEDNRDINNGMEDDKGNTSIEDITDSDVNPDSGESELSNNSKNESSDDDSDSDGAENWDGILAEEFNRDIPKATPLPEPHRKKSRLQKVNSLVFWLVYFLLIWQASCKISDNGLVWLLQFLFKFLKILGVTISNEFLADLISVLPTSLYLLRQFINLDRDYFTKYVVCSKCTKLYSYDSCLKMEAGNRIVDRTCSNTFMTRGRRKSCNAQLVRRVKLKDGKVQFYPIYYYCYNSIIEELERLLQRKGIPESCEECRNQPQREGILSDVYSGKIWKDFQKYKGHDFLSLPRNYGLMLNFDFFSTHQTSQGLLCRCSLSCGFKLAKTSTF